MTKGDNNKTQIHLVESLQVNSEWYNIEQWKMNFFIYEVKCDITLHWVVRCIINMFQLVNLLSFE